MGDHDKQLDGRLRLYRETDTAPIYEDDREVLRRISKLRSIPGYKTLTVVMQRQDPPLMDVAGQPLDVAPLSAGKVDWGTPHRMRPTTTVKNMRLDKDALAIVRRLACDQKSTLVDIIHVLITTMVPVEGEVGEDPPDVSQVWANMYRQLHADPVQAEIWQLGVDAQVMGR